MRAPSKSDLLIGLRNHTIARSRFKTSWHGFPTRANTLLSGNARVKNPCHAPRHVLKQLLDGPELHEFDPVSGRVAHEDRFVPGKHAALAKVRVLALDQLQFRLGK